jgi:hypothetical protein
LAVDEALLAQKRGVDEVEAFAFLGIHGVPWLMVLPKVRLRGV